MTYVVSPNGSTTHISEDGDSKFLSNFNAKIVKETKWIDGDKIKQVFTIRGQKTDDEIFPEIEVDASQFPGMSWVMEQWGNQAQLGTGSSVKDHLRAAIQSVSTPVKETVYTQLGWATINGTPTFLHASGGITSEGNDKTIRVVLSQDLENYDLSAKADPAKALQATFALRRLAPPMVSWPGIAAIFAPLFGPTDFACHVTGRTGTFKSEWTSLLQSHYGPKMDSRKLPGSWSSTPNALEALAWRAKNCLFAIDDFVPTGTSWQIKQYQTSADRLIRAQGNQGGRARLTDASNLQQTMYPRGVIYSTGEDTPEGHSVRGRMMISELSPGDIKPDALTEAQKNRAIFSAGTAAIIQILARNPDFADEVLKEAEQIRNDNLNIGHTRTPTMVGRLIASVNAVLEYGVILKAWNKNVAQKLKNEAYKAIVEAGAAQSSYLEESDPVDAFIRAIRNAIQSGAAHFRTLNGGVPKNPQAFGWKTDESSTDEMSTWKSQGKLWGWVNMKASETGELYVNVDTIYGDIKRFSGGAVNFTQATMLKRLKDSGKLIRTDDSRQRNTIRITAENHPRTVIVLNPVEAVGLGDESE